MSSSSSSSSSRYTCPFVEKFSIDIETHYKPDTGNQPDVFNMGAAEKRQRTLGEAGDPLCDPLCDPSACVQIRESQTLF